MTTLNQNRPKRFSLALAGLAAWAMAFSGCSSSDDGRDGDDSQLAALNSLSGLVRMAGGAPLPDVTVSVGNETAVTDSGGFFVVTALGSLPVGMVAIEFDGSTATPTGPLDFPELEIMVQLSAGTTELILPQVITLPDLNNTGSANQSLTLNGDGTAAEAIDVVQMGGQTAIELSGAAGTLVTIDGMVGGTGVDLNVTPVAPEEIPMPLPDGLQGNAFVTIQPGNARFDQPDPALPALPIAGLDIVLPNPIGLPLGMEVDIWSFDHSSAVWVNRSDETGQRGTVELDGGGPATRIVATGVITEGGWHTSAIPVDATCATRVIGCVLETGTGNAIPGASIAFDTGQFATTGTDGCFTSPLIPAYDVADLMNGTCTPKDLEYEIVLPPSFGGDSSGTLTIPAADIALGGTTDLDDVPFTIGTTGSVAGVILGPNTMGEDVSITPSGGAAFMATPNASGSFFLTGLEAGSYIAAFLFDGASAPTEVSFTVLSNALATIAIQEAVGTGSEAITVLVLEAGASDDSPLVPAAGATIRLQGTDSASSVGLIMIADANGEALFTDVDGPYSVTAQKDFTINLSTFRFTASLVAFDPVGTTIGIPIIVETDNLQLGTGATLSGTVTNLPQLTGTETLEVIAIESGTNGSRFNQSAAIDCATGAYTLAIPSDIPIDVILIRKDSSATSEVLATLFAEGVGMAAAGSTLMANLDFTNSISWDEPVMVSLTGAGPTESLLIESCLRNDVTGFILDTVLHSAAPGNVGNVTLNLPDQSEMALAGFTLALDAELQNGNSSLERGCDVVVDQGAAASTLAFLEVPILTSPTDQASLPLAQLDSLQVAYTPSTAGPLGNNGLNSFSLTYFQPGQSPPMGIDGARWQVFLAPGQVMFELPPAGLPMFGDGLDFINTDIVAARYAGVAIDFRQLFNEGLAASFMALDEATGECESRSVIMISTQ